MAATTRTVDLWHAAGRAAHDGRKRLIAMQGVLWSAPVLVLGSFLTHVVTAGADAALEGLRHPFAFVVAPLKGAYLADHDLALLCYVGWQLLLLVLLWGYFGGALYRLAAVDLALGSKEEPAAALRFARRHWRGLVGARLAIWLAILLPLGAAVLIAMTGRIPGVVGGILLALGVVLIAGLALVAVVLATINAAAGFLSGPTVAAEDSNAFDAVSRTFTYAAAGLPRLVGWRLLFFGGVLIGTSWRLVRTVLVLGLGWACLSLGAGQGVVTRASAVLGAMGTPADAERLGLGATDYVVAVAIAIVFAGLVALWLADLVSRIVCARTGVYLLLRRAVDGEPVDALQTRPAQGGPETPESAGFVEVGRVGDA
ncbi:MAG: hypothetical protein QNJ98_15190 [Planctomycetota bacterium]|nr:hypothetical protein [Planctomycetota bacterium]